MATIETLRTTALSFTEVQEQPHFEKTSFRVKGRIFVTYDSKLHRACVKLSAMDQDIFSLTDHTKIYPVNNRWAKQGWTFIEMKYIQRTLFQNILLTAYN